MIVELDAVKAHLRIDADDDDTLLSEKIAAAQIQIERLLGYTIEATYGGADQEPVPEPLREAVLQLVATWYEGREATSAGEAVTVVPFSVEDIVREYREWSF